MNIRRYNVFDIDNHFCPIHIGENALKGNIHVSREIKEIQECTKGQFLFGESFTFFPYQLELLRLFLTYKIVIVVGARQIGTSTTLMIYAKYINTDVNYSRELPHTYRGYRSLVLDNPDIPTASRAVASMLGHIIIAGTHDYNKAILKTPETAIFRVNYIDARLPIPVPFPNMGVKNMTYFRRDFLCDFS